MHAVTHALFFVDLSWCIQIIFWRFVCLVEPFQTSDARSTWFSCLVVLADCWPFRKGKTLCLSYLQEFLVIKIQNFVRNLDLLKTKGGNKEVQHVHPQDLLWEKLWFLCDLCVIFVWFCDMYCYCHVAVVQMTIDAIIVGLSYGKNIRGGILTEYTLGLPYAPTTPDGQPTRVATFCRWVAEPVVKTCSCMVPMALQPNLATL